MRFFTAALIALSTLVATVFAAENPITYPSAQDKLKPGQTIVIKWTPTTPDKEVSLVFREGPEGNLNTIGPIVDNCPNTGSYSWTVPKGLVAGKDYAIEIKFKGGVNYSPQFEIDSTVTARTTTTDTTATTATTTTATTTTKTSTANTTTATSTTASNTTLTTTTYVSNTTVTAPTFTTTSKTRTTDTSSTSTGTGAPNPHSSAGIGKTVSSGLVAIVAAAWALTL